MEEPGARESPIDEFIENPVAQTRATVNLPSVYGNTSKSVYNQGGSPTCWAFASTSAFEYAVDKKNNIMTTSFSVEHLVEKLSIVGNCGFVQTQKRGLDTKAPAAYFISGYGPADAEKYPWGDDNNLIENYDFGRTEYRATDIRYIDDECDENGILTNNTNNIDVGTASVTITGIGNFTSNITKTFAIVEK